MRGYNVIVVYNENADKILMCKRPGIPRFEVFDDNYD